MCHIYFPSHDSPVRCPRPLLLVLLLVALVLCTGYEYIISVTIASNNYAAYLGKTTAAL